MEVFILAIVLVGIAIGGFAIKMFLIPGETFKKTCGSSFDPETGKTKACSCASGNTDDCHNSEKEKKSSDLILNIKKMDV